MTPRLLYWSVRRELWENRSIYIAPLAAAGVVLLGFAIGALHLSDARRAVLLLDPTRQHAVVSMPYQLAAAALILTGVIVAMFYCLGALHNERRDRSILFWKSLPVSDLTTVLSKAAIPLAVMPAVVFVVAVATQLVMLVLTTVVLLANGVSITTPATQAPLLEMTLTMLYGLVTLTLWYAPVWGWLLLVSGWAKRAPFLWAVLPPLAVCLVEKIAFDSTNFASMLANRLGGGFSAAFSEATPDAHRQGFDLQDLDPIKFLSTPGLWVGLALAIAFLATAVWLRRRREPI